MNTIWSIKDSSGNEITDQSLIEYAAFLHFKQHFEEPKSAHIGDQLKVLKLYPSFFTPEEGFQIDRPVSLEEYENVLKGFKKERSPGPDGRSIDLFLKFFISWALIY